MLSPANMFFSAFKSECGWKRPFHGTQGMKVRIRIKMNEGHVHFVGLDLSLPRIWNNDASYSQHLLSGLGKTS